jgi:hypothetical protein
MHSTTQARSTAKWLLSVIAITALVAACAQPPGQTPTQAPTGGPTVEPGGKAALVIDSDVVQGPKNLKEAEKPLRSCVQASRFAHNEQVVWRVKVLDGATGEALDDKALTSVQAKLPDQTFDLKYGGHPAKEPADFFWTSSWVVPEGYPSGSLEYTIVATAADGRTATWEQFKVTAALLTITDEVREVIATPVPSATP